MEAKKVFRIFYENTWIGTREKLVNRHSFSVDRWNAWRSSHILVYSEHAEVDGKLHPTTYPANVGHNLKSLCETRLKTAFDSFIITV